MSSDELSIYHENQLNIINVFKVFWAKKIIIISSMIFGIILALIIINNSKQWWESSAEITHPQYSNYSGFINYADKINIDKAVVENLNRITNINNNYTSFINLLSSKSNKLAFLQKNKIILDYLNENNIDSEDKITKKLNTLSDDIIVKKKSLILNEHSYTIVVQADDLDNSYSLLNDYIDFTTKIYNDAVSLSLIKYKETELINLQQQLRYNISYTKNIQKVKIQNTQLALNIAEKAGINEPLSNYYEKGSTFNVALGSKALKAENKAIASITDLSVLNGSITQLNSKIKYLENIDGPVLNGNSFFSFIQTAYKNPDHISTSNKVIVLVFALLFICIGMVISLALNIFSTRKTV
ncbi:Wzz/FepE/Etk N-terminal domain-containing protein [uncultured Photobacterium sp.]|uniref:Wzz/FepE/Etk N-terminal domain-containing protein n=1 Tax=uncultured Photobacterium sp. TaxID=173973 RepID=UPI00261D2A56|nr:Wzz/FepE/Etk N-terminal domain-containing protein [uncultured Photobacterium sp.]